jgi:hypothetical protein
MSSTPHADASHAARFGRKSSGDPGLGEHVSKEEKKRDFDRLNAAADRMERDNFMFVKNSRQELDVWRKLDRNGDGKSNLNELWTYIESTYPDLKIGAQRSFLPNHSIAERIAKVSLRRFADSITIDITRHNYPEILCAPCAACPAFDVLCAVTRGVAKGCVIRHHSHSECRYSCPIVLRALLLFEQLDSDDDDSLNEKEFLIVCHEIQKRNMYASLEKHVAPSNTVTRCACLLID